MKRDEEFFLECRGYNFLCEYLREKYPKEYYMTLFRDASDVLKDCVKGDASKTVLLGPIPHSKVL